MNFQNLHPVEDYQFYIDLAFRRAREGGKRLRAKKLKGGRLEKSTHIELMKMQIIADTITARMDSIGKNFPSINQLPVFYQDMLKLTLDDGQLRKSLGAINWLRIQSRKLFLDYKWKLVRNKQFSRVNIIRGEFLGRISSLVKQVKKDFLFLEAARKTMKGYPDIKEMPTVAIAGFPNVGKTTLLYKLTGSKGEINSYPFTTKGVNVAYIGKKIQLLDTPGTLNRLDKMNFIEKIAHLAIKHSHAVVYVFDPTEEYPLKRQIQLYKLTKTYKKPLLCYLSKIDIAEEEIVGEIIKKFNPITNYHELKEKIKEIIS
ncbi:GTP-binding protein [Candidatus Woesearchaeota archaeon]|nr:GTP-binding protein [Candidatus Woesearchaeota archaeon]